ncbi:MAG TPA: hypothetical protein VFL93_12920 [Longimicrobiaceae bacterium]|nr:hypothetical protein [Longimicrobiaceae bacterium]
MTDHTRARQRADTWAAARAFTICAVIFLVAAAAIAVLRSFTPITRAWWLVAYLSLVGGISQLLLGPGLIGLAGQRGARLPARGARRAQLVTWNGGTLLVAVADLVPSAAGVLVGSIVLVVALVLFARGLREVSTTANRLARGWTAAYVVLLIFLAGSVVIGTLLAFARGR